jgi:hypothetical protein
MFKRMLAISMVVLLIAPMVPPIAFAAGSQNIYSYIDADEKQCFQDARNNLTNFSVDNWDKLLQPLLTDGVRDRLGDNAEDTLKQAAQDAAGIFYTDNAAELEEHLTEFKDTHLSTFKALFDDEITMNDLDEFLIAIRSKLKSMALSESDTILYGTNAELAEAMFEIVREAAQKAITQPEFGKFRDKLVALGWSTDFLIQQHQVLAGIIDPGYQAELALVKAWVRSEAKLKKGEETLTPVGTLYKETIGIGDEVAYTLSIIGFNATRLVGFHPNKNDPNPIILVKKDKSTLKVTGMKSGTEQLIFYRDGEGCTPENDWIAEIDITVIKEAETRDIKSVADIADVNVAYGTVQENIGLPIQIEVTLDDGSKVSVDFDWDGGTPDYNGNQAGTYTFTGTLTLPENVTNKQNLTASVKVIVNPKKTPPVDGGGPSSPGGPADLAPFDGTEIKIDKGGKVSEHGTTLEVPAEAFAKDLKVKITKVADASKLPLPEGGWLASEVLEITKDEKGDFKKPVTITMAFDKSKVDSKAEVTLCWYDPSSKAWIILDNIKVDWDKATVSGETNHFTKFAVIAVTPEEEPPVPVILTDVMGHWAEAEIKALAEKGAIAGYPDQTFRPNNNITRAEFATVLVKAFQLEAKEGRVFADTATHWVKDAIATAGAYGIIKGYSGEKFGPNDNITREQMAVMVAKAANLTIGEQAPAFSDSAKISDWAKAAVAAAAKAEIIKGYPDESFRPQGLATRAEAVTVIVKALEIN